MSKPQSKTLATDKVATLNRTAGIHLLCSHEKYDNNGNRIFHVRFIRPVTEWHPDFLCTVFKGIISGVRITEDYVRFQASEPDEVVTDFEAILRKAGVTVPIHWFKC